MWIGNKGRKKFYFLIFIFMVFLCGILYGRKRYPEWKEARSGVPDIYSSMLVDNEQNLIVIANSSRIDDKEAFARQVIHMCQENSFHSVRFSTDLSGYPSGVNIIVYLNEKDVDRRKPVCEIEFSTDDNSKNYDIKNNADKFRLYLDGKEIEFY